MSGTANVFESSDNTSSFLSELLGSIEMGKSPEKHITDLNLKILTNIISLIPLRERMDLSLVSHQFHGAVRSSIKSLNFYKDNLDCLPDNQVREMLKQYGSQVKSLNFDLFKSTFNQETSQWVWRQTVLAYSGLCPNLTELNILICNRHRLRDKDLVTIFEKCTHLTTLRVDAQFLNGHCFKKAPLTLTHLEMEMCYRISDCSLRAIFGRLRKMKTLHVSQLLILTDDHVKSMVRSFRHLQEVSIVSHVDTKYESLSGAGLGELGKLTKLRVLCLEGLGAVTDRTLTLISDPHSAATASTLTTLSLAFCYNVSQHGLKHLRRLSALADLNIDGITKRDVSMGVEKIAAEGRLVRLFIAERTNISPEALISVVAACPNLRLLDISNNEECFNWVTAEKIKHLWCGGAPEAAGAKAARRAPLTILTDEHLAWNCVGAPEEDELGRAPLLVVHIRRGEVPESELLPTTALSNVRPSELPPGLLAPHIRRGNRYRLLWAPLGPSKDIKVELFDENDNGTSVAELALRAAARAAEDRDALDRTSSSDDVSSSLSMEGVECCGLFGGVGAESDAAAAAAGVFNWGELANDENQPPLLAAPLMHTLPLDFSASPISAEGDPHTKDWSMDVMSLLLKTYAYEDGAMVGPMTVKEGIIMRPDGSVEDICASILKVDASLRARYHMTAALTGARRYGMHTFHNPARDPACPLSGDQVTTDIASAIDDFLRGYVPEESQLPSASHAEPPMQHMQPRPRRLQSMHNKREFPFELQQQELQPVHQMRSVESLLSPFASSECGGGMEEYGLKSLADSAARSPFGACENEAPPGHYAGRSECGSRQGARGYGDRRSASQQQQQHHNYLPELQLLQPVQQDYGRLLQPLLGSKSGQETGAKPSLLELATSPSSVRPRSRFSSASVPFAPAHLRGGQWAPPVAATAPAPGGSSFPFPPPPDLLSRPPSSNVTGVQHRPSGGVRQPFWLDAKFAPHPYADAAYRARPSARGSILRPRN